MTWQYNIEWHSGNPRKAAAESTTNPMNIVVVTSKPRARTADGLIRIKSWLGESTASNQTSSGRGAGSFQPIAIFAQVLRGNDPVLGARVSVRVDVENLAKSGSKQVTNVVKLSPFELVDDGYGGKLLKIVHAISFLLLTFPCFRSFFVF